MFIKIYFKVEHLLSRMRELVHCTIIAEEVNSDMADGDTWARLMCKMVTFNFFFSFTVQTFTHQALSLDSFCTRFWLVEKQWYVIHDQCLRTYSNVLYSNPYCGESYPNYLMHTTFTTKQGCHIFWFFRKFLILSTLFWLLSAFLIFLIFKIFITSNFQNVVFVS